MNYQQTLEYLYAQLPMFHRVGAAAYKADLGNTLALCRMTGNPERAFPSVHVAGTNGKGSTSHLLASVMQASGYKTGLYTSPHLSDFRERIRVNGKMIPRSYVTRFVGANMNRFSGIQPSFFEYTAVMAFQYFKDEEVDVAVIETGMGGRLDSTNVVTPELCVITNISFDHKAFLGNTLPTIAAEKAGIIKPGIPVLIGETQRETSEVFMHKAKDQNAPIWFADQAVLLRWLDRGRGLFEILKRDGVPGNGDAVNAFNFRDLGSRDGVPQLRDSVPLHCPLRGLYQEKNFVTAFRALEILRNGGYNIQDHHIKQGFAEVVKLTGLRGRWETIRKRPRVICDVGHNEAGIKYITEQLKEESFNQLHWVFGMVSDKESNAILGLLPKEADYYFCRPDIPRGLDQNELKGRAHLNGLKGNAYSSVKHAYQEALKAAKPHDLILVAGSTFVVAEVI